MAVTFQKATRHAVKLKIGVDGASGSGKTMGALALATGITHGGRLAVADSENGSAALYADRFAFDTVLIPDAEPDTYKAIIDAAVAGGYDALVIDSLSHAWLSVLAAKEEYDRRNPKSNSWTNWRVFGPKWDGLMQHILQAPIHIVATMRSKQAYEQVEAGGRKQVVKLGLQPQVRDGAEYEFGLVFSVNQAHAAEATKDRTGLFPDRLVDLCDPKLHAELRRWMDAGGPGPATLPPLQQPEGEQRERPTTAATSTSASGMSEPTGSPTATAPEPPRATTTPSDAYAAIDPSEPIAPEVACALPLYGKPESWGGHGGQRLDGCPEKVLDRACGWFREKLQDETVPDAQRHRMEVMVMAIPVVLAWLARDQAQLPLEVAAAAPPAEDPFAPFDPDPAPAPTPDAAPVRIADPDSVYALTTSLNARLGHEDMPLEVVSWFKQYLIDKKPQDERTLKRLLGMAGQCLRLGRLLADPKLATRTAAEVYEQLRSGAAYKPDALEKLIARCTGAVGSLPAREQVAV